MTGQIHCSPGYTLQKHHVQEVADSTHTRYTQPYSDECMEVLRRIILTDIREENKKLTQILICRYRWGDFNHKDKARKIKITTRTFNRRLNLAHERVYDKMIWSLTR